MKRCKRERDKRTVRCPIASGDHAVHALLRADLLAKRRDPGVSHERGVERIHAVPRRISCMGAELPPFESTAGAVGDGGDVRLSEVFHRESL